MEYAEFNEWKRLKKEKKYKEAVETLEDEMATNLLRVHNYYSDVKYDEKTQLAVAFGHINYGKNSKMDTLDEMRKFVCLSSSLSIIDRGYCDILEDEIWGTYKELLKDAEKLRRKIVNEFLKHKSV